MRVRIPPAGQINGRCEMGDKAVRVRCMNCEFVSRRMKRKCECDPPCNTNIKGCMYGQCPHCKMRLIYFKEGRWNE